MNESHTTCTPPGMEMKVAGIRHSSLPKLAQCACYESNPDAGPAAARGTRLDAYFRELLSGAKDPFVEDLSAEDMASVQWAVWTLRSMAPGEEILSAEEECKVSTPGMEHIGTADAIVPGLFMSADLKSGQIRNYREQMAAYALGLMETYFTDSWTCELLFCDQKQVITHRFTYAEAFEIVTGVLVRATDPGRSPQLCEYCGWCAKAQYCEARTTVAAEVLAVAVPVEVGVEHGAKPFCFELVLNDATRLGSFLAACKVLDDFREAAEERARVLLETDSAAVPGWKLRKGSSAELVFADDLERLAATGQVSVGGLLAALGALSGKKFRELWLRERQGAPLPEALLRKGPPKRASLVQC